MLDSRKVRSVDKVLDSIRTDVSVAKSQTHFPHRIDEAALRRTVHEILKKAWELSELLFNEES